MNRLPRAGRVSAGAAGLLTAWLLLAGPTGADTLELAGGRNLEGIVIEETPERVVLDIGMGQMSFARDQVLSIQRATDGENLDTREAWKVRYIAEGDLPEGLRPLYRDWDRLQAIRKRATDGARGLASAVRDQDRLEKALDASRKEYAAVSAELATTPIGGRDVTAYNAKVQRNNELVAQINRQRAALTAGEKRQAAVHEAISRYARELTRFEHRFEAARADSSPIAASAVAQAWLAKTATSLAACNADFSRTSIPVSGESGSTLLEVTLNDQVTGTFILDTGASVVTLTEPMARRLKLQYDPDQPILLRLADGKTSEGYPVVLDAVAVGEARAERIGAVVVPNPPGPGLDGLLGMSFLSRFEMQFDAASNRLELRELRAR